MNLERSLEKLMEDGVDGTNIAPPSYSGGILADSDMKVNVTQCNIETLVGNIQGLTLKSPLGTQTFAVSDANDVATAVLSSKSMLDGNVSGSCAQSVDYGADCNALATQLCKIFKEFNLHITGTLILPNGNRYDRIFNVGGGNCYFYAVCQGRSLEFLSIMFV